MQAVVERVIRAFFVKHPLPEDRGEAARQGPPGFAANLLESYRARLAQRPRPSPNH